MPRSKHPKKASKEIIETSKKLTAEQKNLETLTRIKKVRIMFQDEAGFGRINKPKYCWCNHKIR